MLELLQRWLTSHLNEWSSEMRHTWRLEELSSLDLARFPVDESSLDPDEMIRKLRIVPPSTKDTFAMFLRDALWNGITIETSVRCPNCQGPALKILHVVRSDEILLSCDQCAWVQTPNGLPSYENQSLEPTTSLRLRQYRAAGR